MKIWMIATLLMVLGCEDSTDLSAAAEVSLDDVNQIRDGLNLTVGGKLRSGEGPISYDEAKGALVTLQYNQVDFLVTVLKDGEQIQSAGDDVEWDIYDQDGVLVVASSENLTIVGNGTFIFKKPGEYEVKVTSKANFTAVEQGSLKSVKLIVEAFDLNQFLLGSELKGFKVNDQDRVVVSDTPEGIPMQFYLEKDGAELHVPSYVQQSWQITANSNSSMSLHPKLGTLYPGIGSKASGVGVEASFSIDANPAITKSITVDVVDPVYTEIIQEIYFPLVESANQFSYFQLRKPTGDQEDIKIVNESSDLSNIAFDEANQFYHSFSSSQVCSLNIKTHNPVSLFGQAAQIESISVPAFCSLSSDLSSQISGDHLFTMEPEPADLSNVTLQQYDYVYLKYWYELNDGTRFDSRSHLAGTIGDSDNSALQNAALTYYETAGLYPAENAYFDTIAPNNTASIAQTIKGNHKTFQATVVAATAYNNVKIRVSSVNDYGTFNDEHHSMCLDADQMMIDVNRGLRFVTCNDAKATQRFDYTADRQIKLHDQSLLGGNQCLKFDGYFKLTTCAMTIDFRFYRRVMNTKDDDASTPPRVIFHNLYSGMLYNQLGQTPSRCLDYSPGLSLFSYKECGIWSEKDHPTVFELISD
ncbi:MAG: hypothetical protein ISP86_01460 [Shewanellaceae bacterium]|nr:hypothetical protein [Shewanellaceae bacterium]